MLAVVLRHCVPPCLYVIPNPLLCNWTANISVAHAESLAGKTAAVGNSIRRRRGRGSAQVSPTHRGRGRGSCRILHRHHFLPNHLAIFIKTGRGLYGHRIRAQDVAFLANLCLCVCVRAGVCVFALRGAHSLAALPSQFGQRWLCHSGVSQQMAS